MEDDDQEDGRINHPSIIGYADHVAEIGAELRQAAVEKMQPEVAIVEFYPRQLALRQHALGVVIATERSEQLFTPADNGLHIKVWNALVHPAWAVHTEIKGRC